MDDFPDEARLAHTGFPHDGDDLPVPSTGEQLRAVELFHLRVAAYEPRQPAPSARLETGSRWTCSPYLVAATILEKKCSQKDFHQIRVWAFVR